jgi:hypothetical protein
MEWRDEGVLLSVRAHGEAAAIIEVFTAGHGRHAGVVRGGASRRMAPVLQPGAQLDLAWRARLEEHIGAFTAEPLKSRAGLMADRRALARSMRPVRCCMVALPEREPHSGLYAATLSLLDALEQPPTGRWSTCGGSCACWRIWVSGWTCRPAPSRAGPMGWPMSAPAPAARSAMQAQATGRTGFCRCRRRWPGPWNLRRATWAGAGDHRAFPGA